MEIKFMTIKIMLSVLTFIVPQCVPGWDQNNERLISGFTELLSI